MKNKLLTRRKNKIDPKKLEMIFKIMKEAWRSKIIQRKRVRIQYCSGTYQELKIVSYRKEY